MPVGTVRSRVVPTETVIRMDRSKGRLSSNPLHHLHTLTRQCQPSASLLPLSSIPNSSIVTISTPPPSLTTPRIWRLLGVNASPHIRRIKKCSTGQTMPSRRTTTSRTFPFPITSMFRDGWLVIGSLGIGNV